VGVYVDDLLITGTSTKSIGSFKQEMAIVFKMSDLGLLTYYLGIQVQQSSKGTILSQESYAKKILEKGGAVGVQFVPSTYAAKAEAEERK
jgi:hypothetical protein